MSETNKTLEEYLSAAISQFCSDNGFGLPGPFVYCVSRIDSNGEQLLTLGDGPGQQTWQSLGLVSYLHEWFRDDAKAQIAGAYQIVNEDED